MSIRHGVLALLSEGPKYGNQLGSEFEERTGATWPLNGGQVHSTLTRLERDGLVVPRETGAEGRHRYSLTDEGRAEVATWFAAPVPRDAAPSDELAWLLALDALLFQSEAEIRWLDHCEETLLRSPSTAALASAGTGSALPPTEPLEAGAQPIGLTGVVR